MAENLNYPRKQALKQDSVSLLTPALTPQRLRISLIIVKMVQSCAEEAENHTGID